MLRDKDTLAHFNRLGRAIAKSRITEPLPRDPRDVMRAMCEIDSRSGKGTKDPFGGDLASHIAHIRFFRDWVVKQEDSSGTSQPIPKRNT